MSWQRPNILFVMSDQHNAKVLGHQQHPDVRTPNLDRLAAEGVRFDNCIPQNPICTPSRVSFLSGQYPHNHGYYGNHGPHPGGLPTVLGHFRRAGYRTAAVGKIHCPEYWVEDDADYFREVTPACSVRGNPEYAAYLEKRGLQRDSSLYPSGRGQSVDGHVSGLSHEDSAEGWTVRQAIPFMEDSVRRGLPFFAWVTFPKPHQLYTPSEPFWSMYDESALTLPPNSDYDLERAGKAPNLIQTAQGYRDATWTVFEPRTFEAGRLRKLHGYLGCVSQVDHAVGELLAWLDRAGIADRTLVIYTSDHGDYATEHGLMEKAPGICSDAITRVPSIWRWPGRFQTGHVAKEIVEAVDLAPTLCELAGLEDIQTSDGRDISPLLRGEHREIHRMGVTERVWSKAVRRGRYRYVYYPREMFAAEYPDGFAELYDLETDPWEMENLYFQPQFAALVRELYSDLLDWLVTTTRPRTLAPALSFDGNQAVTRHRATTNPDGKVHPDRIRRQSSKNYL